MMRIGGSVEVMTRDCTDDVCVRSSTSGLRCMKNVSCMSRAGWSAAKLSDENTCQSSSTSGPSAIVKPNRENIDMISSLTKDMGWRRPKRNGDAERVRSISFPSSCLSSTASRRLLIFSVARFLSSFSFCPISFFCSLGTFRKSLNKSEISPFLLRYFMRRASTSSLLAAVSASIAALRLSIFSNIAICLFQCAKIVKGESRSK